MTHPTAADPGLAIAALRVAQPAPADAARPTARLAALALAGALLAGCGLLGIGGGGQAAASDSSGRAGAGRQTAAARTGGGGSGAGGQAALPVVTAVVARDTVSSFLVATTTLSAERAIDVMARASGVVTAVAVEAGDAVTTGQLLGTVDQRDARLSLAEAQAHYDNAQRVLQRTQELAQRNAVSNQELENQRYQFELRRIALERARQQLADTEIRSPLDGMVGQRFIDVGATISGNTRAFSVLDADPLLAVMHIPEARRGAVRPGQRVQVSNDAGIETAGTVARISPIVDAQSGTVRVTVQLAEARQLLPGMFVTVRVPTATRRNVLVVPKRAVLLEREQTIVFVVADGSAARTPVQTGLSTAELIEVTSGLQQGARVVVVGQEGLRDGAPVREAGEPIPTAQVAAGGGNEGASAGAAASPGGGRGAGGFSLAQMPAERRDQLIERLLTNEQVKAAYDARLAEDPSLARDQDKRAAFFAEQLQAIGGFQALGGGRGGGGGGGFGGG